MTVRFVCTAIAAGLLATGAVATARAHGHAQDGAIAPDQLPDHSGQVTVVGCVQQGLKKRLVLVSPTTNRIDSVPDGNCNLPLAEPLLEIHDTHEYHFDN